MPVSSTSAGMRNYVPRRPAMSMDTVVGPDERAKRAMMLKEVEEAKLEAASRAAAEKPAMKKGGKVAKYARGGGIEQRGKTRGKMC